MQILSGIQDDIGTIIIYIGSVNSLRSSFRVKKDYNDDEYNFDMTMEGQTQKANNNLKDREK